MSRKKPVSQRARATCAGPFALFIACVCAGIAWGEEPQLKFLEAGGVVEATGVPPTLQAPAETLKVTVISGGDDPGDLPAVAGTHAAAASRLTFTPRFGFDPGIDYRAALHIDGNVVAALDFRIEKPVRQPSTVVSAVYPGADVLPENQLRFYIHFSAPMSRGSASRCVRLYNVGDGTQVVRPFLELDEELWDPEGRRLTLFFDPGRVKRGLQPHEEDGPVLIAGNAYQLVVDADFEDADGLPLRRAYSRTFRAAPVDYTQPDPGRWRLTLPDRATREPLKVSFPSPLDHAMLQRMITVIGPEGRRIEGTPEVTDNETAWNFTPEEPWREGGHALRIDRLLEDSCGNSIARHFEVARVERTDPVPQQRFSEVPFAIGGRESAASARQGENWGEWRGPQRNGISPEPGLPVHWSPGERLVWQAETAGPGASTPVVWGDRVFVTAQTGRDAKIQRPGVVLARADEELELCIQCFRRSDGVLQWEKRFKPDGTLTPTHALHNQCTPSCVTDGERVIAWFATGQLFCHDMDGNEQWSRDLARDVGHFDLLWAHASSPALFGDFVYLLCDHDPQANLLALTKSTGALGWKAARGAGLRSYSTPVIHTPATGVPQIIVNSNPGIDGYDAHTGSHLWRYEEFCKVPVPVPVVSDGVLFASRGYTSGPIMALPLPSGPAGAAPAELGEEDTRWRMASHAPYVSSPLAYNGRIYLSSENGLVRCLDQATGEMLWSRKLGTTFWSSPVAGDGHVYLLDEAGEMIVLADGPGLTVLARNSVPIAEGERMLGSPAISHGCLFYRSESRLFCVGTHSP